MFNPNIKFLKLYYMNQKHENKRVGIAFINYIISKTYFFILILFYFRLKMISLG